MTPSNLLSLLRGPLALLFIVDHVTVRSAAILLAMVSDCIDGYLARRYGHVSKMGIILDPVMDRVFVYTVSVILLMEKKVVMWQLALMMSRDGCHLLFALYLTLKKRWDSIKFGAVRWGKIITTLQFIFLLLIVFSVPIPDVSYLAFVLLGLSFSGELLQLMAKSSPSGHIKLKY